PMARDVSGLLAGMRLLEPGFEPATRPPRRVGRLRVECEPVIDAALDAALAATGWEVVELSLPGWDEANVACGLLLVYEAWQSDRHLAESSPEKVGGDVLERLRMGRDLDSEAISSARAGTDKWRKRLTGVFEEVELVATPTLTILPSLLEQGEDLLMARCTLPVNLAGVPALALPVPTTGPLPASLQLVSAANGEELLLGAGAEVEAALQAS
ncbi:MAG: amidase family protein, partial [Acidimicrobiales bacterium]